MRIVGRFMWVALGLLALGCSEEDETDRATPGGEAGDGAESPPRSGLAGETPGTMGDCAAGIAGDGPYVEIGEDPLQVPAAALGGTLGDAYRFRAGFGFLHVALQSDVTGRARIVVQGPGGPEVMAWDVPAGEAVSETLRLPRGGYALLFEPADATAADVQASLEASAYDPMECEPSADAPEVLSLGPFPDARGGYVGRLDASDTFRFELPEPATLSMGLEEVQGELALGLFVDADPSDEGDAIATVTVSGGDASQSITLPAGTYQLRVSPALPETNNLYTLSASVSAE